MSFRVKLNSFLYTPIPALPFQVFRIGWGLLMIISAVRFMALGWIEDHYVKPIFHFKYWGFEWVEPISRTGLYITHILIILASIGVAVGTKIVYRISAIVLFVSFTYTELIDLTYYLNHYYFVSLICFLLCLIPSPPPITDRSAYIPAWVVYLFKFQISLLYIYAGLAKINEDWLIHALPLKIWLPAHYDLPIIGNLFAWKYTSYIFSWLGMLYDCTIPFWLMWRKSRPYAYIAVIVFHAIVGILFQIGVFPLVMIVSTLIFFDFDKWMKKTENNVFDIQPIPKWLKYVLSFYIIFQVLYPWRYVLYSGNLFWTEEGYRFSWRVMLMEKAGTATFYVKDTRTGKEGLVNNREFLNDHQEKQMAMQPDMILQFAHFLGKYYEKKGIHKPEVRAEVYVTLNGRPSQLLIDPNINLMQEKDTFKPKKWILPYPY
ncbi:MAG: HTTM domain-containing protein [Bacteroidia bacterium]|nr:HTTM domain-containing protein [Bacteroidia bacterium]MDW8348149.1 HTTM domain-containing protein [Bacteroidia bacterium]